MFPITCNAFGDIVAVIQLIHDIVKALDDARGAADEYARFVHVLTTLGAVMEEVYCLAQQSRNEDLKQAVLAEARRVCDDISKATDSISGFDKLTEASKRPGRGRVYSREVFAKLRWRFRKASDAEIYAKHFSESLQRLNAFISLLG